MSTPLQRFFKLLQADKREIYLVYAYAAFNGIVNLSLPLGIQAIIGFIMGGMVSFSWILLVFLVIVGIAVTGGLQVMQMYLVEILQQRVFTRAALEFAFRIPRFKLESLRNRYAPEIINRFFDTISVQKGLGKVLIEFSTSALQVVFGLILLSFYHPFFVFFGLMVLFIVFLIIRFTGPKGLATSLIESKHKYEVAHWLQELSRIMNTFKLAGDSQMPGEKTDDYVNKYLDARKGHFRVLVTQYFSIIGFKVLVTAGLLILGGLLVIDQQINLGQFVAAEIIIILILNSIEKIIQSLDAIYDVLTALEKIGEVVDLPIERQEGICFNELNTNSGVEVKVEKLSYQYEGNSQFKLQNINIQIKPNQKVCITGFNNSGKSTLLNLISGFYENYEGNILYNGFPLQNLNMGSIRQHIGDILSHEQLFAGSILENISMNRKSVSIAKIKDVCEALNLHQSIVAMPHGYETKLVAEGRNISRSLALKIIIARAVVDNPQLLVLEEFMHNLEYAERQLISNYLTNHNTNWSLIAVSNDAVFASKCDKIIILKQGQIIDQGTFNEIKQKPYFSEIYNVNGYA